MADIPFDDLTEIYDSMVDWPKRLAFEGPFYHELFDRVGAKRVIDVACGTGHHAAMFRSWGLVVEASDISAKMIERAKVNFADETGLGWTVRGFEEPIRTANVFDVAICIGNSLALARDLATAELAIEQMFGAVRSGGVVVVHVLNLWRLPDGPCVWQKFTRFRTREGDVAVAKGVNRANAKGYVNLVIVPTDSTGEPHAESVPFLGMRATELENMSRKAGAQSVQFFGGYRRQPYEADKSIDLIMVAKK